MQAYRALDLRKAPHALYCIHVGRRFAVSTSLHVWRRPPVSKLICPFVLGFALPWHVSPRYGDGVNFQNVTL